MGLRESKVSKYQAGRRSPYAAARPARYLAIGSCYSAPPRWACFEPKRALLVLRLPSVAARRASTCWACLLCGPCAFPLAPPNVAKCVGIFRLPAAVDIVATCFPPGVARVFRYRSI